MDPFRQLLLQQVQFVLKKEASKESLHELLKISTPDLSMEDAMKDTTREKALKVLKLRIHPDKHPDTASATKIFQDVQDFYSRCCVAFQQRGTKRKSPSPSSVRFPLVLKVEDIWRFLDFKQPKMPKELENTEHVPAFVAYQCINARGAIVHGKKTTLSYGYNAVRTKDGWTVSQVFDKHGGTKILNGIEEIKEELMERGPVVSTSFCPSNAFVKASEFKKSRNNSSYDVLITGWKLTEFGEMWFVQPLKRQQHRPVDIPIAFGQFGIDDTCVAPISTFEDTPWQSGKCFDWIPSSPQWRTWTAIKIRMPSLDLEKLGSCLEMDFISAAQEKTPFVLRDKIKKAHSRKCYLKEMKWDKVKSEWCVKMVFVD